MGLDRFRCVCVRPHTRARAPARVRMREIACMHVPVRVRVRVRARLCMCGGSVFVCMCMCGGGVYVHMQHVHCTAHCCWLCYCAATGTEPGSLQPDLRAEKQRRFTHHTTGGLISVVTTKASNTAPKGLTSKREETWLEALAQDNRRPDLCCHEHAHRKERREP